MNKFAAKEAPTERTPIARVRKSLNKKVEKETITARLSGESLEVWKELQESSNNRTSTQLIKEAIALRYLLEIEKQKGKDLYYVDDETSEYVQLSTALEI